MDKVVFSKTKDTIEVGYSAAAVGTEMPAMHYHAAYELFILASGHRTYIVNGKLFQAEKMDVVLIPPQVIHKTGSTLGFERYIINFTDSFLNRYLSNVQKEKLLHCFYYPRLSLSKEQFQEVLLNWERIHTCEDEDAQFLFLANILYLLSKKATFSEHTSLTSENPIVENALQFMNQDFSTIETLNQIAEKLYITKYHLCRVFKNATGISVWKYLTGVRIQHACYLLDKTSKSITEIALECGFQSSTYFCRQFKAATGLSPLQYRKK